jgi:hypothetical protein
LSTSHYLNLYKAGTQASLTWLLQIMCLKVKYMHFYVTIWLELWRKNHCYGVIMIILLPHTCTPWPECMKFFSMDPLFDLAICALQVCFTLILPKLHISLLEVGSKAKHQCLGEDTYTIERFDSTIWGEGYVFYCKSYKNSKYAS